MTKYYNLFLDDIRFPKDARVHPIRGKIITGYSLSEISGIPNDNWFIVRSYDEFVKCIERHGIPNAVSFDHDLHDEHMQHYFDVTTKTGKIEYERFQNKTGKHCAEFLVDKIKNLGQDINIKMFVHSANIWGVEEIRKTLSTLSNDQ